MPGGKLKFCAPPPTNFFPKNNELTSIVEYNRIYDFYRDVETLPYKINL